LFQGCLNLQGLLVGLNLLLKENLLAVAMIVIREDWKVLISHHLEAEEPQVASFGESHNQNLEEPRPFLWIVQLMFELSLAVLPYLRAEQVRSLVLLVLLLLPYLRQFVFLLVLETVFQQSSQEAPAPKLVFVVVVMEVEAESPLGLVAVEEEQVVEVVVKVEVEEVVVEVLVVQEQELFVEEVLLVAKQQVEEDLTLCDSSH